jgi:tRNA G18 (ribose-2'-O)-methylase SpoU
VSDRVREVASAQNPLMKELRALLDPRGMRKHGEALIAGRKLVGEALRLRPEIARAWVTDAKGEPPPALTWVRLEPALFRGIDVFGTDAPLLVVETPEIESWDPARGLPEGFSLIVPFQDPENLGAVARSAVAFGVDQVILLRESAHPFHPKALRASGGALLRARLLRGPSLADLPADPALLPLSPEGRDLGEVAFPERGGLLLGLEGPGLPVEWRARAVRIPMHGGAESLNAAVAASIALYEWSRRRSTTGRP